MRSYSFVILFIGLMALFLAPFNPHVNGTLVAQPCALQGNPWKYTRTIDRQARLISMVGENAGHNPFNTFPGMMKYGNCIVVYFSYKFETINVTIACETLAGKSRNPKDQQCPRYTPNIRWPLSNLIYLEYDVHRFEVSSCVQLNKTHSYNGHLLLMDDTKLRMLPQSSRLPMWRQRLEQADAVRFQYDGSCGGCNFRNEYVAHVPHIQYNMEEAPPEALPYCKEDPNSKLQRAALKIDDVVKLLGLVFGLIITGMLIRHCLCNRKSKAAIIAPVVQSNGANRSNGGH